MMGIFEAIILTWGLMYFATAIIKPDLLKSVGDKPVGGHTSQTIMLVLGFFTLFSVYLNQWWIFLILGTQEAFGAVESYTGYTKWNVPENQRSHYQLAMAFMDYVAGIAFFTLMFNIVP